MSDCRMPLFEHDSLRFHFRESGAGVPVVFQHGLGGDVAQPFGLFAPPPGFRLLALDCRGHGQTRPLGDPARIRIATFVDDLLAWLDHLQIARAVLGGISLGAAVALQFALRYPHRTIGLILSRPAWLAGPNRTNAQWYREIAELIGQHGPQAGEGLFRASATCRQLTSESPAVVQSMLGFFTHSRAAELVIVLEQLEDDAPCGDLDELAAIRVPTLVLANRHDPVHPFDYGEQLAAAIPGADFREVTAKSVSVTQHQQDVQDQLSRFLQCHFT